MCDRIRYYRLRNKLTQQQVAEKMGIATNNYQKYEAGQREPTKKTLPLLAEALGTSEYSLLYSDKEQFVSAYNKHIRELAMQRWEMYSITAEEFMGYDIADDTFNYFDEWFSEIRELDEELSDEILSVESDPELLLCLADIIFKLEYRKPVEDTQWKKIGALETEERPAVFWYFIVFGYVFLREYTSTISAKEVAAGYVDCLDVETEAEAFDAYIRSVFIPFFDHVLTAVEYMLDENAALEKAIDETLIGERQFVFDELESD